MLCCIKRTRCKFYITTQRSLPSDYWKLTIFIYFINISSYTISSKTFITKLTCLCFAYF